MVLRDKEYEQESVEWEEWKESDDRDDDEKGEKMAGMVLRTGGLDGDGLIGSGKIENGL